MILQQYSSNEVSLLLLCFDTSSRFQRRSVNTQSFDTLAGLQLRTVNTPLNASGAIIGFGGIIVVLGVVVFAINLSVNVKAENKLNNLLGDSEMCGHLHLKIVKPQ
ncbi:hypothetical protein J2S74_000518 [Evansella vedderi]|uniref:Uncharacterized protein n=1 Tax=Evansella vedderi TaxID=38282 RepID=A0ABT9ZPH7_9BACI|nr:hypothetical protein [Evansella vedderi]MDQ0253146.1 hypothetical protein [Evansella vedderi]